MAAKPLDIHPEALVEFRSALTYCLDQNESAGLNFVAEIDNAIELITASPRRWPAGARRKKVRAPEISLRGDLSRKRVGRADH